MSTKIQADEISSIIQERIDNFELNPDDEKLLTLEEAVIASREDDKCIAVVMGTGDFRVMEIMKESIVKAFDCNQLEELPKPNRKRNEFGYVKRKFR